MNKLKWIVNSTMGELWLISVNLMSLEQFEFNLMVNKEACNRHILDYLNTVFIKSLKLLNIHKKWILWDTCSSGIWCKHKQLINLLVIICCVSARISKGQGANDEMGTLSRKQSLSWGGCGQGCPPLARWVGGSPPMKLFEKWHLKDGVS